MGWIKLTRSVKHNKEASSSQDVGKIDRTCLGSMMGKQIVCEAQAGFVSVLNTDRK